MSTSETESDAGDGAGSEPEAPPLTDPGPAYVVARWRELSDVGAVWWARPCEVGLRLRLDELVELAQLNALGVVQSEQLDTRRKATVAQLTSPVITDRFPHLKPDIEALARSSVSGFKPAGRGPAATRTLIGELSDDQQQIDPYIEARIATLAQTVADATWDIGDLRDLDESLNMLDAEIAHIGHSPSWRRRAATALEEKLIAETEPEQAITEALCGLNFNKPRDFDVLIPVNQGELLPEVRRLASLPTAEAVGIARSWPSEGRQAALDAVASAGQVLRMQPTGPMDLEAAATEVSEEVRRATNLWGLQGLTVEEIPTAFISDPLERKVSAADLPQDPLDLRPDGLGGYTTSDDARVLDDALDQLAEARTAAAPAALVNLWTVVETLYGGVLDDSPHLAGAVLTGVGEYCYVHDVLRWLAHASQHAGLGDPTPGDVVGWVIALMGERKGQFGEDLQAAGAAVTWARWKSLTRWNGSSVFGTDLTRLKHRFDEVADRAYLIRNFAVHQAMTRDQALNRILPAFAGLVQASVGHSLRVGRTDEDLLSEALRARAEVRGLAEDLAQGRKQTPAAVEPFVRRSN